MERFVVIEAKQPGLWLADNGNGEHSGSL